MSNAESESPESESPVTPTKRRWPILVASVVLLGLAVVGARAAGRGDELELRITFDDRSVLQGEELLMTLVVENVSKRAVTVDRWSSLGPEDCLGATGLPLSLSLYFPPLSAPVMQFAPEPGNRGLGPLEPGETMELRCNVARLFNLVKPGKYVLEAGYVRDRWAGRRALGAVARLWSSLIVHDRVPIEIIARHYDDPDKM